ncbi:unnamed protein product [Caenorhabditis brenneri]
MPREVIPITPTALLKLFVHYFLPEIVKAIDFKKYGMTGSELLYDYGEKIIDEIVKSEPHFKDKLDEFEQKLAKIFLEYYNTELAKRDDDSAIKSYRYFITEDKEKEVKLKVCKLCDSYIGNESWRPPPMSSESSLRHNFIKKFEELDEFMKTQVFPPVFTDQALLSIIAGL